jgi:hypothetical protein
VTLIHLPQTQDIQSYGKLNIRQHVLPVPRSELPLLKPSNLRFPDTMATNKRSMYTLGIAMFAALGKLKLRHKSLPG